MNDRERLRELIQELCLLEGDFTLSTGAESKFYFDCKCATLNAEGLTLIAKEFLSIIRQLPVKPDAIGGLTMGADFMTAAVAVLSFQTGEPINGSIARKEPKKHGTKNKLENELAPGTKIVVVDDVITTGKSTLEACRDFEDAGYEVVCILGVVDREAGGKETLQRAYPTIPVKMLFTKSEFPMKSAPPANVSTRAAAHVH